MTPLAPLRLAEAVGVLSQVARQLGISPKTSDHHIQRLYRKTGIIGASATVNTILCHTANLQPRELLSLDAGR